MIEPVSFTESLLFGTVRVETRAADGSTGSGTAFFFRIETTDSRFAHLLITNRHVVRGASIGMLRLHRAKAANDLAPSGQTHVLSLGSAESSGAPFEGMWHGHPDPAIDLCAMNATPFLEQLRQAELPLFWKALDRSFLYSNQELENLMAMENVIMIGYPIGLSDLVHNLPIIRTGITASHPAVDFEGRPEGLIDMACFPGSSGSPILLYNQTTYYDKRLQKTKVGPREALLGVLHAGPHMNAAGEIVICDIPTSARRGPVALTPMMIHLGFYIKAREVLRLAESVREQILAGAA